MKVHIRYRHTGEKAFGCDMCQERFTSIFDLNQHRFKCLEKTKNAVSSTTVIKSEVDDLS